MPAAVRAEAAAPPGCAPIVFASHRSPPRMRPGPRPVCPAMRRAPLPRSPARPWGGQPAVACH
eukprot:1105478-Pleurochrysis_carterae.AAC.1